MGIIEQIESGAGDAELEQISKAVRSRRREIQRAEGQKMIEKLDVGDRVELAGKLKPRYLRGERGVVVGFTGSRIVVDLDVGQVRKYSGKGLKVPASCVAPEPEEADTPSADQTRAQLNSYAVENGVEEPEKLPNKDAVLDAIEQAKEEVA